MIVFPNAKINLGLHITKKRSDGYHEIESAMVPIPICDALEIIPSKGKLEWNSSGLEIPGNSEDNLVIKAYKLLKKDFPNLPSVEIHLLKKIPMGAGLGGGSADAAFALTLMNQLFDLHLDDFFLEEYAAKLGSDCALFVDNQPKLAKGRGEILEALNLDLKGTHVLLIHPDIHIGTKEAYAGVTPSMPKVDLSELLQNKSRWREELVNDFEKSIFPNHPEIKSIKEKLYEDGAYYAAMSGSGSSVFGLFEDQPNKENYQNLGSVFECSL